jgi:PAS domain S-box-containing protein
MEADALQQLRQQSDRQARTRSQLRWMFTAAAAVLLTLLCVGATLLRSQSLLTRRLRQDMVANDQHLDVALRSVGDAVLVADAQGRVRRMNPAAERLLARSQAQALGQTVEELLSVLDNDGPASTRLSSMRAAEDGRGSDERVRLRRTDGSVRDIQLSAAPLWGGSRNFLGSVYALRDISDELALQALSGERTDPAGHAAHAPTANTASSSCAPAA